MFHVLGFASGGDFRWFGDLPWGLRNDHFSSTHRYNVGGYVYGAFQVRIQFDKYNWSNVRRSCLRSSRLRGGSVVYCGLTVLRSRRGGNLLSRFLDHLSKVGTFFSFVDTPQKLFDFIASLRGNEAEQLTRQIIDGVLTRHATSEVREWMVRCNLKMPRDFAATLLYNSNHTDWRDLIPRINLPALIISGRASFIPWKSQEWIHRQIKGSQFEVFEEPEGGQHFMFIENPEKFNRLVMEYLG